MERILVPIRQAIPDPLLNAVRVPYHFGWALLGNLIYRFPARKLKIVGITGTKGKSTTSYLAAKVLEAGGFKTGLISGVMIKVGPEETRNRTSLTTLGRLANPRLLRRMVKAGCTHVVVEVTSHALNQFRVWGVPFETAVFTNFSQEHLELHGNSMANYRAAKGKLFRKLRRAEQSTSIVNGDDKEAPYFLEFFADTKYVYGTKPEIRDVHPLARTVVAEDVKLKPDGTTFTVRNEETVRVASHLAGGFNVSNALAAVSVGLAYGVKPKDVARGIGSVPSVPGRVERIEAGQPFSIIVDFAHTPDSYRTVLTALREITPGRLITVFGAYGNRDMRKFPGIGKVNAEFADHMILTEDDPGTDDPDMLTGLLVKGIKQAKGGKGKGAAGRYEIEMDRRKAIRLAFKQAKKDDTVAILGKGGQLVMRYGTGNEPWDDSKIAAEEWKKLVRNK
ncbi:MAG: UDP-N-acetylmuramoyl-L-alanyl-D-glutamate--2,6-diaminopimelate ligase [bacterium]|nr:UDP-N-acetylmuramoyl-L-alanyl-D-glutamate--2,6-diaminopimelate ligase [bacterium]MDZ4248452.1 UDP-N-acetylmuramoyl-L-alanyl-D-glutamate--2,6-diaminopimelate ligase [Patescibacteria group bacterium]